MPYNEHTTRQIHQKILLEVWRLANGIRWISFWCSAQMCISILPWSWRLLFGPPCLLRRCDDLSHEKRLTYPSWVQLASRHSFTYAKFYSIILLFGTWEFTWRGFVVLVDVYSVKFIMNNMHYTTCLSSSSFVLLLYMHASLLGIDWSHLTFCVMKWSNLLMTLHIICARAQCLVSHLYDVWQVSLISAAMIRS